MLSACLARHYSPGTNLTSSQSQLEAVGGISPGAKARGAKQ